MRMFVSIVGISIITIPWKCGSGGGGDTISIVHLCRVVSKYKAIIAMDLRLHWKRMKCICCFIVCRRDVVFKKKKKKNINTLEFAMRWVNELFGTKNYNKRRTSDVELFRLCIMSHRTKYAVRTMNERMKEIWFERNAFYSWAIFGYSTDIDRHIFFSPSVNSANTNGENRKWNETKRNNRLTSIYGCCVCANVV